MSLHHPAKRRRLDDALNKPFRSPLKIVPQTKAVDTSFIESPSTIPVSDDQRINNKAHCISPPTGSSTTASPTPTTAPSQGGQTSSYLTISLPPGKTPTLHLHSLQSKHTAYLNRLGKARNHLETSTQALKILDSPQRDANLVHLIEKWRVASRAAAEEVFAGARDKVNRMGGVKGLRERERGKKEESWGWDGGGLGGNDSGGHDGERSRDKDEDDGSGEDNNGDDEGNEEGPGDREERLEREGKRRVCLEEEESEYDRETRRKADEEEVKDEVDEDAGYTMDMMLKTMHVDLNIIGFDKKLQRWID